MDKFATGHKAVGICMRCSKKRPRRELVEDGYYPGLMVCPDCFDGRHPQERLPRLQDPTTIYKPAPDDVGYPPDLSVVQNGNSASLAWTEAVPINARIDSYDVYRRAGPTGNFTRVATFPISYDVFMEITAQTLVYSDTGLSTGTVYYYQIVANTDPEGPDVLTSNTVEISVAAVQPLTGALALAGQAASIPVVTADFALASANINGSSFLAPSSWAFGSSNFTIECKYRRGSVNEQDNAQYRIVRARTSGGAQSGWEMQVRWVDASNKALRLLMRPSSTSFTFTSSNFALDDSTWAHLAIIVDRTNNLATFVVNGASIGTANISTASGSVGLASTFALMQALSAEVDEIRLWTIARAVSDINATKDLQYEDLPDTTGLIAAFQFKEGSGSTSLETIEGTSVTLTGATFTTSPF
jgi:hypothetical protein